MSESKLPHPIVAAVVATLMLGGIGYGIYHALIEEPKTSVQLEQTLFDPYFKALSQGHIDEAWQRYTTPHYKQLFPVERYRQHWQQMFLHSGHIAKRDLFVVNQAYQLANDRHFTSLRYQLTFDHDYVQVVYEVVPDSRGNPRIDWAGQHQSASSLTSPEPW